MKEPISTITNIFYIIVGIILFPNPVSLAFIGLGLTSGWYHWTKTRKAQDWDVRFMFLTFNSIIGYFLYILSGALIPPLTMVILLTAWMWYNIDRYSSTYDSAWQFAIGSTLAFLVQGHLWFIPLFAIGGLCNIPFLRKYHETREWTFWKVDLLHGMGWHLLTATAYLSMFIKF